jgi:hypothetical protein
MKQDNPAITLGQFFTGIDTIRRRARKQIEEGAIADGNLGDPKAMVNLLNKALAGKSSASSGTVGTLLWQRA